MYSWTVLQDRIAIGIHADSEHQFFKHYSWQKIVQSHVFRKLQVIFLLTFKSANDECSYYYFDVFHIFRNELQKHVDDKDDINHMAAVEVSGGKTTIVHNH